MDETLLDAMRAGAYLVNTARAEVVDEEALIAATRSKGLRVGVDVFEGEPASGTGRVESRLFEVPGVIGTHHTGGATAQAHRAVGEEVARIVVGFATRRGDARLIAEARRYAEGRRDFDAKARRCEVARR